MPFQDDAYKIVWNGPDIHGKETEKNLEIVIRQLDSAPQGSRFCKVSGCFREEMFRSIKRQPGI